MKNDSAEPSKTARWRTRLADHTGTCRLSPAALALAHTMASRSEGGMAWSKGTWKATDETMAEAMGWRPETVRPHRKALERAGWWVCERRGSKQGESGVASCFRLAIPAVCRACQPVPNRWESNAWDKSQPLGIRSPNRWESASPTVGNPTAKDQYQLPVEEPVQEQNTPPPLETQSGRAEQSAATASAAAGSSTNGEEEEKRSSGRDGGRLVEATDSLIASDLKAAGFESAEAGDRYLDAMVNVKTTNRRFLRGCVTGDLERFRARVEDWTRAEAKAAKHAAAEAECERLADYRDDAWAFVLESWEVLAWPHEKAENGRTDVYQHGFLPVYGRARERSGLSAGDLLDLLARDVADRKAAGVPVPLQGPGWLDPDRWFTENVPAVAQPATEDPPLPESGKADTREAQVAEWRAELAEMAEPAAEGF